MSEARVLNYHTLIETSDNEFMTIKEDALNVRNENNNKIEQNEFNSDRNHILIDLGFMDLAQYS